MSWVGDHTGASRCYFPGHYLQSRQARDDLPLEFFSSVQKWTVIASLAMFGLFTIHIWRRRSRRLVGLALVIFFTVIANAFVTGALSTVEDRYQSRVVWLLPLLAGVLALDWRNHHLQALAGP